MTGSGGTDAGGIAEDLVDADEGPLARLFLWAQSLDRRGLLAAAAAVGLFPLVVGTGVAAARGFAGPLLTYPGTYLASVGLAGAALLVLWAVHRYPGLWTELGTAFDVPREEYRATLRPRVRAMTDPRLALVPVCAVLAALAYDLAVGIRMVLYLPGVAPDHHLPLAVVNYVYGVVLLAVVTVGAALLYHHVRLVGAVVALPLSDPATAAADLAPLVRFDAVLARGMLAGVGVLLAHLAVLAGQHGGGPLGVPALLLSAPVVGAATLAVVAAAVAAFALPHRAIHGALAAERRSLPDEAAADVETWASPWARRLLGDRRPYLVLGAVLLVVAAAGWGLVLHEPGPDAETEAPFEIDRTARPVDDSYRIRSQVRVDGPDDDFASTSTRVYHPASPRVVLARQTVGGADDRLAQVFYARGNRTYERLAYTSEDQYRAAYNNEAVAVAVNETRTLYVTGGGGAGAAFARGGGTALALLGALRYEAAGTTTYRGREVTRYVPTAGWVVQATPGDPTVSGPAPVRRVRAASGEVLVDPDTGRPLYADVDATVVEAGNWWEALTGDPVHVSVDYRVEAGVDRPAAPPWVDDLLNATADAPG